MRGVIVSVVLGVFSLVSGCGGGGGSKSCTTYLDCSQGDTCGAAGTCVAAIGLGLGESCSADSQCLSGICQDLTFCSQVCTDDDTCSPTTVCLCDDQACAGDSHCVPKCSTPNGNSMECERFNATETNRCGQVGGSTDYGACSTQ